jgi:hypothetical protein
MYRILIILMAGISIALSGCATLSRDECQSGDWHKIGIQDGSDGRTEDRFKTHAKACELDRSDVSRAAYMEARQKGLEIYCTQVRGYREGSLGQKYLGVCPVQSATQFLTGFEFGKRIHQTEIRLSDTANGIYSVSQKLQLPSESESDRAALLREQTRLHGEEERLKGELEKLRSQADTLVLSSKKKN